MVILDNNSVMSTPSGNQYLSPDYSPPLSSPLDSKNSPLALLAQTCSQIGADSSNTKGLLSSDKSKKSASSSSSSSSERSPSVALKSSNGAERKSPETKLAFKPYESNVLTKKVSESQKLSANVVEHDERKSSSSRKSASSSPHNHSSTNRPTSSSSSATEKSISPSSRDSGKSPIEPASKSAADLYSGKDVASSFRPFSLAPLGFGCSGCPPLDPTNPAFRSPFALGTHFSHPGLLDCFQNPSHALASSYPRAKSSGGAADSMMSACKDPYCFTCRLAMHGAVGPCPPGCLQCEQKYTAAMAAAALMAHPLSSYHQYGRPFVCSWVSGDSYCGKRFRTSDELFQHLRTHTSANDALAFMNQFRYPPSTIASSFASRYHPYAKPSAMPSVTSLASSPFGAFSPALSPYYPPPYSTALYDQRIGAAVNP